MQPSDPPYTWSDRVVPTRERPKNHFLRRLKVALVMILLPLVYLEVCVFGLWLIYMEAIQLYGMTKADYGCVCYILIIGTSIFAWIFMTKPIFNRPHKISRLPVTKASDPRLHEFIEEVCDAVGSPYPSAVYVDCTSDVSAKFESGLFGLMSNRLVLTIGLPLADGLTIREFGGVLAHECAYFSESSSMRLDYIIRSINGWFYRSIYERDLFDIKLSKMYNSRNIFAILLSCFIFLFIYAVRAILNGLMIIGNYFNSQMIREMAYNADYFERNVCGQEHFEEIFVKMHLFHHASDQLSPILQAAFKKGKLLDNIPELIIILGGRLPACCAEDYQKTLRDEKEVSKWNSPRPSDHERITHDSDKPQGILEGDTPANVLFTNYEALSKKITLADYFERYHLRFKPSDLIPTVTFLEQSEASAQTFSQIETFFGGILSNRVLIFPTTSKQFANYEEAEIRYKELSDIIKSWSPDVLPIVEELEARQIYRDQVITGQQLLELGLPVAAEDFGLETVNAIVLAGELIRVCTEVRDCQKRLDPYVKLAGERLFLLLGLVGANLKKNDRLRILKRFLTDIAPINNLLPQERDLFLKSTVLVDNLKTVVHDAVGISRLRRYCTEMREGLKLVEERTRNIAYPFRDQHDVPYLGEHLVKPNLRNEWREDYDGMKYMLEQYVSLYNQTLIEIFQRLAQKPEESDHETNG